MDSVQRKIILQGNENLVFSIFVKVIPLIAGVGYLMLGVFYIQGMNKELVRHNIESYSNESNVAHIAIGGMFLIGWFLGTLSGRFKEKLRTSIYLTSLIIVIVLLILSIAFRWVLHNDMTDAFFAYFYFMVSGVFFKVSTFPQEKLYQRWKFSGNWTNADKNIIDDVMALLLTQYKYKRRFKSWMFYCQINDGNEGYHAVSGRNVALYGDTIQELKQKLVCFFETGQVPPLFSKDE
ncbi:MAG: hypothetical protein JXA42_09045 [Anaerolineales bacterium]|nr:hypothetical protein [Anaerolineales bacterium]